MEDAAIIELYFARNEDALAETAQKYGLFCRKIAWNILHQDEDAEECVNDTYHGAWNAMPPQRPGSLRAFLGKITRNLALVRYQREHAQKRFSGADALLSELEDCLPAAGDSETALEQKELAERIAAWLETLSPDDRALFLRRYWYGDAVKTLARERGETANAAAQRLRRLRAGLRAALEEGGFSV